MVVVGWLIQSDVAKIKDSSKFDPLFGKMFGRYPMAGLVKAALFLPV